MKHVMLDYDGAVSAVKNHFGTTPHRVYIATFGCQQNEADSEKMRGMAFEMGYTDAETPEVADLILINTCAIREHAEQKVLSYLGTLKALKQKKTELVIAVAGCMTAQGHRVDLLRERYPYVSFTLDPAALHMFPSVLANAIAGGRRQFMMSEEIPEIVEGVPTRRLVKHRAWVSIMYGCNNFCSYCIVPYVRGRERSRASAEIISEVKMLVEDGCRDITLLGQNVNSYRGDCDFATLLERLANIPGDFVLRFMTSHPKDVPDALMDVMAQYPEKIAPHFHLPLQSGSDEILRRMNRRYTRGAYLSIVKKLREKVPGIALTTDIIVGFPGETDADFERTMEVIKSVRFDMLYSFLYSPRKGTPAATMPDQVGEEARATRMAELLEVQRTIAEEVNAAYVGKTIRVLADAVGKTEGVISGRTPSNHLVYFEAPENCIGSFVRVRIDKAEPFALRGTLVSKIEHN